MSSSRAELHEYQKPDIGRKSVVHVLPFPNAALTCHLKDLPNVTGALLTHLPLCASECSNCWIQVCLRSARSNCPLSTGTFLISIQSCNAYDARSDIDVSGLIAQIDLFPVPPPIEGPLTPVFPPPPPTVDLGFLGASLSPRSSSLHSQRGFGIPTAPATPSSSIPSTGSIFGSSFVHAVHMDWRGEPVIFFVFSDLSVRLEGYFCLRYRFFDLFG